MVGGLAGRCRAVVAAKAGAGDRAVIKLSRGPGVGGVACLADALALIWVRLREAVGNEARRAVEEADSVSVDVGADHLEVRRVVRLMAHEAGVALVRLDRMAVRAQ